MKNPQKSVVDALNGVEALVQALESFAVNRAAGGPTAQDMAEVVAWELNLLPVEGVGVLVCQNVASDLLDPQTLSYSVSFTIPPSRGPT